jgi:membrane protein
VIKKVIKITKGLAIRITKDEVISLSSQLAYSFIFAFFPFLIFLITAVGYSSVSSQEVLVGLNRILPSNAVQLVKKTVIEVVDNPNVHLLSLSLIFTIWSSSGGFNAVIRGLNKAYGEDEYRSMIKIQLISILCTLGVSVIILSTILFLVFGQIIGNFIAFQIGFSSLFKVTWDIVRYIVIILSTIFIFAAIYHYTPCRRLTWREVIPGSIFSTIGLILVSIGFAFYVNNFTNYSMLYGSIGAVIVLLTWLFLVSAVIILGGELNAMLDL